MTRGRDRLARHGSCRLVCEVLALAVAPAAPEARAFAIGACAIRAFAVGVLVLGATGCAMPKVRLGEAAGSFDAQACVENALRGEPDPLTLPLAFKEFTDQCDRRLMSGCSTLGVMYERGLATRRDPLKAAQLYHEACIVQNVSGCANLARVYSRGIGVKTDAQRAVGLNDWSCQRGAPGACRELATAHLFGDGAEKDVPRAAELYRKSCKMGDGDACYALGALYEKGAALKGDVSQALSLFEQACVKGQHDACDGISRIQFRSEELRLARSEARPHPAEAPCAKGSAQDCATAGIAYYNGDGVNADIDRAVGYLQRACSGGYQPSCAVLGPVLHGSCTKGRVASCKALEKLAAPSAGAAAAAK
ncbi:MAG: sel1 repeat family protein [Myxococcales bacterium]|nr:sel1 repeat family protein [Myxococcales bacterium]